MSGSSQPSTPWGQPSRGLALRIATPKPQFSVWDAVEIYVEFRNVCERELRIVLYALGSGREGVFLAWLTDFLVLGRSGAVVRSTGPIVKVGSEPRLATIRLLPGEIYRIESVPLSTLSVQARGEWRPINSLRGEYRLRLIYSPSPDVLSEVHWSGELRSNFLDIAFR